MDRVRRRQLPIAGVIAALILTASACGASGGEGAEADRSTTTATPDATTSTAAPSEATTSEPSAPLGVEGECPDTDAIEAVMGAPVERFAAFGGNLAGELAYGSEGCSYETAEGGRKVTVSRLSSDPPVDGRLFDALADAAARDADRYGFGPIDDLGDDAYLDGRQVVVLDGATMLFIEHLPTDDPEPGDTNPALTLAEAVVGLGLGPSAPDCDELALVVADQLGEPSTVAPFGGFLGLDDVDIATEGCSMDLPDGTEVTISLADGDSWDPWVDARSNSLFTSGYEELEIDGRAAFDTGDRLILDDGGSGPGDVPFEVASEGDDLDAAEGAALRLAVAELLIDD